MATSPQRHRGRPIRLSRRRPEIIDVPQRRVFRPPHAGPLLVLYGFAALIAVGTILLLLPVASHEPGSAGLLTALFTSTSAVCVTGLVVVDTWDYWTPFGQVVILALIQLGGLGFMTSATLMVILLGRRLSLRERMIAEETMGRLGSEHVRQLVRRIVLLTVTVELTGALLLILIYSRDGFAGLDVWRGIFTAVSAFNNAGFDIEGNFVSLAAHEGDPLVVAVPMVLVMLGGLGYAVIADVGRRRSWARLALNTKLVLLTSGLLWIGGALGYAVLERQDGGTLEEAGWRVVALESAAMSVFSRTAGFAVTNMLEVQQATLLLLITLMFIGGAAASTAGGIKMNTFSTLGLAILASIRGQERVTAFGREIPSRLIYRALSVALLSVAMVIVVSFVLAVLQHDQQPFLALLFETVSAFGTVGLSAGVTTDLSSASQWFIILTMYAGRLGPLTIALALAQRTAPERIRYPQEEVSIG